MNTIVLNDVTLEVTAYNKNTFLENGDISSSATCSVITSDITTLNELSERLITSIKIYNDETLIYDLHNIEARISNISEYLNSNHININLTLLFRFNT